jgi:hypothetical protein
MTALSQGIKRKLSVVQLADELGNVAKPCRIMGFHRDILLRGAPHPGAPSEPHRPRDRGARA